LFLPIELSILKPGDMAREIKDFLLFSLLAAGRRLGRYLKDKMLWSSIPHACQRSTIVIDPLNNKPLISYGT